MSFSIGAGDDLFCDVAVVRVGSIGDGIRAGEEEEREFEGARFVDFKGVAVAPLGVPGFLGVYGLRRQGGGHGGEVPHLVIAGLVGDGGLIDQPDFDGVVHRFLFMVVEPNGDVCGFSLC